MTVSEPSTQQPEAVMRVIYAGGFVRPLAVLVDPGHRFHLWLHYKHPDGQWVSLAALGQVLEEARR